MKEDVMIPWATVETLSPEAMSVALIGEVPRDFADCDHILQRWRRIQRYATI
ncbi:hypothetical protein ACIBG0_41340 [Nocardia sp. NPDC050630]|uniref:hypothetical protein n=1 Tax=Nocardia sp. NPDC050630 TaxID=3364321 RepID=UPI0037BB9F93